jgi:two-component system response regulator AtoC
MNDTLRALVVDDEPASRMNIRDLLREESFRVEEAIDGLTALERMEQQEYDVVLLDIRMPKMDGLTVLKQIAKRYPQLPVIVFTAHGTSEHAIEAMKVGAFDYLTKPFDLEELLAVVRRAVEHKKLSTEVQLLRQRLATVESTELQPAMFVSRSKTMQKVFKLIGKVAPTNSTVLIEGETGTGKELVANAIWHHSQRNTRPFLKINCAAIPEGLLESELFGHERGAFTGAYQMRQGQFELANGGTLFFDEIGEMSPALQAKILRVLEHGEFQRVGGKTLLRTDVRIICATNRTLAEEVKAGRFRKDLFYRLQVVHIVLPPLRSRKEDIPLLVQHFIKRYGGRRELVVTRQALEVLQDYSWPGNVRELEHVIERAVILSQGKFITPEHIALPLGPSVELGTKLLVGETPAGGLRSILKNVERSVLLAALERTKWNKTKAAALLQIDRRFLLTKIKEYDLKPS